MQVGAGRLEKLRSGETGNTRIVARGNRRSSAKPLVRPGASERIRSHHPRGARHRAVELHLVRSDQIAAGLSPAGVRPGETTQPQMRPVVKARPSRYTVRFRNGNRI